MPHNPDIRRPIFLDGRHRRRHQFRVLLGLVLLSLAVVGALFYGLGYVIFPDFFLP